MKMNVWNVSVSVGKGGVGNCKLSENHAQRNTFDLNECWKGKGIGYCANEVLMCCVRCMFIA